MCNICRHPSRRVIDRDLLACPSVGAVAAHHRLPYHEAVKHKTRLEVFVNHARRQVEQLLLAGNLHRLHLLLEKTMQVVTAAEENGDLKLMLQAVREAQRLTKMIQAIPLDLEPAALLLTATAADWPRAATPLPNQAWVEDSVRRAIHQYLKNPCAGSHSDAEFISSQAPSVAGQTPGARPGRTSPPPRSPAIPWTSTCGEPAPSSAGPAPMEVLQAVARGRAGSG